VTHRGGGISRDHLKTSTVSPFMEQISWDEYLRRSAVPRDVIDQFLERPDWATFDSELGWVLHNSFVEWGMDESRAIETFLPAGARSRSLYAASKPRINTYGDSYTESNQVSDGETWQEYLAGHFGEPVGNFGVGGYGVYQAYRRMLRIEQSDDGAECVLLYIWGEDPRRSVIRSFWGLIYPWHAAYAREKGLFHGNPSARLDFDLAAGAFREVENPLPTPDSLYAMCDPGWMLEFHRDDLALQLAVYAGEPYYELPGPLRELDREKVDWLARTLDFSFEWEAEEDDRRRQAASLLNRYAQRGAIFVVDKARDFLESAGKTLLVVLNYTARPDAYREQSVAWDGSRRDQELVDHLEMNGFNVFDMNLVHQREYEEVGGLYSSYMSRYMVDGHGHYSPRGNHFFAYTLKNTLLELLDPKPLPYRYRRTEPVDFSGYLSAQSS
jgi:hypothetical protein